jgi:hypothetical protein
VARIVPLVSEEQRRNPRGYRAVGRADLGIDRGEQQGESAQGRVRAPAILQSRDRRLIDPGQVLDLALGQARVRPRGPDLSADHDQRVGRRAIVPLSDGVDPESLLQESLVHVLIQAGRSYLPINPGFIVPRSRLSPRRGGGSDAKLLSGRNTAKGASGSLMPVAGINGVEAGHRA